MRILIILAVTALASSETVNRDKRSYGNYEQLQASSYQPSGLQNGGYQTTSLQSSSEHSASYQSSSRQSTVLHSAIAQPVYNYPSAPVQPLYNVQPQYSVSPQVYNVQTPVYNYPVRNRIIYREPVQSYAPIETYPVQSYQRVENYTPVETYVQSYRPVQTIQSIPIRSYNPAPIVYQARNGGSWNTNSWC